MYSDVLLEKIAEKKTKNCFDKPHKVAYTFRTDLIFVIVNID